MSAMRSPEEVILEMYARAMREDEDGMIELLAPDFELDVSSYVFKPGGLARGRWGAGVTAPGARCGTRRTTTSNAAGITPPSS